MTVVPLLRPSAEGAPVFDLGEGLEHAVSAFRSFLAARGLRLSDEQLDAVTAPLQPQLVVAGAGSGKTTVMEQRVAWLVGSGQVQPGQVLGLTFTVKAAGELAARARATLAELGEVMGGLAEEPTVLTYNAYAARLVSEHGLRLGVDPGSHLMAQPARYQLAERVLRQSRATLPFLADGQWSDAVANLVALEGTLNDHGVDPGTLVRAMDRLRLSLPVAGLASNGGHGKVLARVHDVGGQRVELAALVEAYRRSKARLRLQDFGDQVAVARRLAEQVGVVRAGERARWQVVLLDEYQDTSESQRALMVGLFGGRGTQPPSALTAVGDPNQSIYEWRGASAGTMAAFPTDLATGGVPAPVRQLSVSRRCEGNILTVANAVKARVGQGLGPGLAVDDLRPVPGRETAGEVRAAVLETYADECQWVVEQVAEAHVEPRPDGSVTPWNAIAVLCRTRATIGPVWQALVDAGLPVEVVGLGGLLEVPDVAAVVAVLRCLDDASDSVALLQVLTGPRWRIGPRDLAVLKEIAQNALKAGPGPDATAQDDLFAGGTEHDDPDSDLVRQLASSDPVDVLSLDDALRRGAQDPRLSEEAQRRVAELGAELRSLRRHAGEPLVDLVHRVVTTSGLSVEVAADPGSRLGRRGAAVDAFRAEAGAFVDLDGEQSLTAFLAYLDSAEEHDRGMDARLPTEADAVQLLTVHRAKGLEWDVVVLPSVTNLVFPGKVSGTDWARAAAALPPALRKDRANLADVASWGWSDWKAYQLLYAEVHRQQELRLLYVAVTRARRRVALSSHWWGPTQKKPRGPSAFFGHVVDAARAGGFLVEGPQAPAPAKGTLNPLLAASSAAIAWPPQGVSPAAAAVRRLATETRSVAAHGPDSGLDADEAALVAAWDAEAELLLAEARERFAPERDVVLPARISVTQALQLAADPQTLAASLVRPMPRRPEPAALRGTRFHAWVERRLMANMTLPLRDPDLLDDDLVDDTVLDAMKAAFLASPWADRVPYAVEVPVDLVVGGRALRGMIDAVYRDEGQDGPRWLVVDWKTGRQAADALQLSMYRLAWAKMQQLEVTHVEALFVELAHGARETRPALLDEAGVAAALALPG